MAGASSETPRSGPLSGANPRQGAVALVSFDVSRGEHVTLPALWVFELVRVFADVGTILGDLLVLLLPLCHCVVRLLVLQPLEYGLVFQGDSQELPFARVSIEAWLWVLVGFV